MNAMHMYGRRGRSSIYHVELGSVGITKRVLIVRNVAREAILRSTLDFYLQRSFVPLCHCCVERISPSRTRLFEVGDNYFGTTGNFVWGLRVVLVKHAFKKYRCSGGFVSPLLPIMSFLVDGRRCYLLMLAAFG